MRMILIASAALAFGALLGEQRAFAQTHGSHHGTMPAMEITTSIADGATVTGRPNSIAFSFNPPMRLVSVRLTTATGEIIPTQIEANETAASSGRVSFAALGPDTYTLTYVVDAGDHQMPGRVGFTIR